MDLLVVLLALAGVFTLALGLVHIVLPRWLDLERSVPLDGPPLEPVRVGRFRYALRRQDVRGITWVMNQAASYVLVTAALADFAASAWIGTAAGRLLALWLTGWWVVRAGTQLTIGRRSVDVAFVALFAALAVLHLGAALR